MHVTTNRVGHPMAKVLILALFIITLSYEVASGQFCQQLPQPLLIEQDFANGLGSTVDQSSSKEFYYNCIAYDGASRNFKQTTVTVTYRTGSSVFSAQATYVCGQTDTMTGTYLWAIGNVMPNAGTPTNQSMEASCRNCMAQTTTTCTGESPCIC